MRLYVKKYAAVVLAAGMMLGATSCGSGSPMGIGKTTETSEESSADSTDEADGEFNANSSKVQKKTKEVEKLIDQYFYFEEDAEKREENYESKFKG